jgi:formyltetrahydrofolate deformylase
MAHPEYILTLSCLDQRGIVHRVSGFLADHGCNIIDSAQFGDAQSRLFFMRVHFRGGCGRVGRGLACGFRRAG